MTVDTKALREKAMAATPGEWRICRYKPNQVERTDGCSEAHNIAETDWNKDAAHIAAASPATLLELLDEIERLRGPSRGTLVPTAQLDAMRARLARAEDLLRQAEKGICVPFDICRAAELHGGQNRSSEIITDVAVYFAESTRSDTSPEESGALKSGNGEGK